MEENSPQQKYSFSKKILLFCLILFVFSACVRLIVWQNHESEINNALSLIVSEYKEEARTLLSGDITTFLCGKNPPSNADILSHPPGYPIFVAIVFAIFGESEALRIIQILFSSFAPLLIFLISIKLFDFKVASIAGFLVAVSPQISYNSAFLLADSLSILPILLAIYFFIKASEKELLLYGILCGVLLGISCWFRSNGLLIPVYFAVFSVFLFSKKFRLRFALMVVMSFVAVISPITIRNYLVFHSFIPVSLGSGWNALAGIADYDKEGKFGLTNTDTGRMKYEAKIHNRPDYKLSLYNPDGIERERERTKTTIEIITSNPFWFAGVVTQRAWMIIRLERVPPMSWTNREESINIFAYYLNIPLKLFQRLFITAILLPIFVAGIILLWREKRQRKKLLILLIVPLYYITVHAFVHTEYRYVVVIQHIFLIFAAVVLSFVIEKIRNRFFGQTENFANSD
ncbi:MAG: glycosyltransferase family 39 protein [Acidobacteriota bacterium]